MRYPYLQLLFMAAILIITTNDTVQAQTLSSCVVSCNSTVANEVAKCQIDFKMNGSIPPGNITLEYPNHQTVRQTELDPMMTFALSQFGLTVLEYQENKIVFYLNKTLTSDIQKVLVAFFNIMVKNPQVSTVVSSYFNLTIGNKPVQCERDQLIMEADIPVLVSSKKVSVEGKELAAQFYVLLQNKVPIGSANNTINVQIMMQNQQLTTPQQDIYVSIQDKEGLTVAQSATLDGKGRFRITPSKNYSENQQLKIFINTTKLTEMPTQSQVVIELNGFNYPVQKNYVPTQISNQNFEEMSLANEQQNNNQSQTSDDKLRKNLVLIISILGGAVVIALCFLLILFRKTVFRRFYMPSSNANTAPSHIEPEVYDAVQYIIEIIERSQAPQIQNRRIPNFMGNLIQRLSNLTIISSAQPQYQQNQ
eukprot:403362680